MIWMRFPAIFCIPLAVRLALLVWEWQQKLLGRWKRESKFKSMNIYVVKSQLDFQKLICYASQQHCILQEGLKSEGEQRHWVLASLHFIKIWKGIRRKLHDKWIKSSFEVLLNAASCFQRPSVLLNQTSPSKLSFAASQFLLLLVQAISSIIANPKSFLRGKYSLPVEVGSYVLSPTLFATASKCSDETFLLLFLTGQLCCWHLQPKRNYSTTVINHPRHRDCSSM